MAASSLIRPFGPPSPKGEGFLLSYHCRRYSPGVVPSTFLNNREK